MSQKNPNWGVEKVKISIVWCNIKIHNIFNTFLILLIHHHMNHWIHIWQSMSTFQVTVTNLFSYRLLDWLSRFRLWLRHLHSISTYLETYQFLFSIDIYRKKPTSVNSRIFVIRMRFPCVPFEISNFFFALCVMKNCMISLNVLITLISVNTYQSCICIGSNSTCFFNNHQKYIKNCALWGKIRNVIILKSRHCFSPKSRLNVAFSFFFRFWKLSVNFLR